MTGWEIPANEIQIVEEFLDKFIIISEGSSENIDIMLMLKALPNKIMDDTLVIIDLFNFRIFQESLLAFQNLDIVNAFEYFDEKNK